MTQEAITEAQSMRMLLQMPGEELEQLHRILSNNRPLFQRPVNELLDNLTLVMAVKQEQDNRRSKHEERPPASSAPSQVQTKPRTRTTTTTTAKLTATIAGANAAYLQSRTEQIDAARPEMTEDEKRCLVHLGRCEGCPTFESNPGCAIKEVAHVKEAIERDSQLFAKMRGYERPRARASKNTRAAADQD